MLNPLHNIPCLLSLATAFAMPLSSLAQNEAPTGGQKPNVVLIVSDDMGWNDVGYHGSEIRTPNIDRLAAEGVELDRFYAHPVCSPTRAALMTGRSPIRYGILRPLGTGRGLPVEEYLLPRAFQQAGYQTWLTGKWHLGAPGQEGMPHRRGFDHFYGFLGGYIDYYRHTSTRSDRLDWQRNGEPLREEGYATDLLTDEALRLLDQRDRARPFLLYLAYGAAHTPLQAPAELIRKYGFIEDRDRRIYAAMVEAMDTGIGRVLKKLEEQGERKNTLVIYFNDNGGARAGADNQPLAGGKGGVYEGGIRVAALANWPGVLKAGVKSRQLVSAADLFPTLVEAAGIQAGEHKPFDGRSIWPHLTTGKRIERDGVVIANEREMAILRGPWKLIRPARESSGRGLRLFNLDSDPVETQDVAGRHPDRVESLEKVSLELQQLLARHAPQQRGRRTRGGGPERRGSLLRLLDTDEDRVISEEEIQAAPSRLKALDKNGDGKLSREELGAINRPRP